MNGLLQDCPEYTGVQVEAADELQKPEPADSLPYWYVPAYVVDDEKTHEGTVTKEDAGNVCKAAPA